MDESNFLIPDWETDLIFAAFPQKMHLYRKSRPFFNELLAKISRHDKIVCLVDDHRYQSINGVQYIYKPNLDIWIKDFAPFFNNRQFYQFKYQPDDGPLPEHIEIRTSFAELTQNWPIEHIDLITDGGNFVHNGETVIFTERIYEVNPHLSQIEVDSYFYRMGAKKVIAIPEHQDDFTGHADGMIKFINKNTLLITNFTDKPLLTQKIKQIIQKKAPEINFYDVPFHTEEIHFIEKRSASGVYANFFQTKNAVYFPLFGNTQDETIRNTVPGLFNKPVEFIRADSISKEGGLVACSTWNMPSYLLQDWLKNQV